MLRSIGLPELLVLLVTLGFIAAVIGAIVAIANAASRGKAAELDEFELMKDMNDSQRMLFQGQMISVRKSPAVGVLLTLFLGGFGAHRFYLGQVGLGIVYLFFFWTFVPSLVAFIEVFFMTGRVLKYNAAKAMEIAGKVRGLQSRPATGVV